MNLKKKPEAVQKRRSISYNNYDTVMPDTDPASPAFIKERRSRIKYGMTPFLDSLAGVVRALRSGLQVEKLVQWPFSGYQIQ